ncbi:hypothetical protein [Neptunicoccus cionae]|uniref:hypothetical protein n=1 Tax=Neptunicoccus cionae TaxID=2035344 RepID=UPI0015E0D2B6|nr:hypothetical protein [Amylibacter cionae]
MGAVFLGLQEFGKRDMAGGELRDVYRHPVFAVKPEPITLLKRRFIYEASNIARLV